MTDPTDQDVIMSMMTIDKYGNMVEHPEYAKWPKDWTAPESIVAHENAVGATESTPDRWIDRHAWLARTHDWIVRVLTKG